MRRNEHGDSPGATWTNEELDVIGAAEDLRIASLRPDGTLRTPVVVWGVRRGHDLYVRSVNGRSAAWFRGTQDRREGRVSAGGVERDVRFVETDDPGIADALDTAYRTKYRRYAATIVDAITGPTARAATLKLVPR